MPYSWWAVLKNRRPKYFDDLNIFRIQNETAIHEGSVFPTGINEQFLLALFNYSWKCYIFREILICDQNCDLKMLVFFDQKIGFSVEVFRTFPWVTNQNYTITDDNGAMVYSLHRKHTNLSFNNRGWFWFPHFWHIFINYICRTVSATGTIWFRSHY